MLYKFLGIHNGLKIRMNNLNITQYSFVFSFENWKVHSGEAFFIFNHYAKAWEYCPKYKNFRRHLGRKNFHLGVGDGTQGFMCVRHATTELHSQSFQNLFKFLIYVAMNHC